MAVLASCAGLVRGCQQVLTSLTISNGTGWRPDGTTMRLAGRREPGPRRLPGPDRFGISRSPTQHLSDEQILFIYRTFNGLLLGHLPLEPAP
jgi:hypothetical protein